MLSRRARRALPARSGAHGRGRPRGRLPRGSAAVAEGLTCAMSSSRCGTGAVSSSVRAAARLIGRTTAPLEAGHLLYVLQALRGERYTAQELEQLIPREAVMAGGMFAKELRLARAMGRAEGLAEALRSTFLDIVGQLHPAVLGRAASVIEACHDPDVLRQWTLAAARMPTGEFVWLVRAAAPDRRTTSRQRRAPRQPRRAASRRH
jgi:hypothetical protein